MVSNSESQKLSPEAEELGFEPMWFDQQSAFTYLPHSTAFLNHKQWACLGTGSDTTSPPP